MNALTWFAAGFAAGLALGLPVLAIMAAKIIYLTDRIESLEIDLGLAVGDDPILQISNLEQISRLEVRS